VQQHVRDCIACTIAEWCFRSGTVRSGKMIEVIRFVRLGWVRAAPPRRRYAGQLLDNNM
jgi:hypothetical protein